MKLTLSKMIALFGTITVTTLVAMLIYEHLSRLQDARKLVAILADSQPGQTTSDEFKTKIKEFPQSGFIYEENHISFGIDNSTWFSREVLPLTVIPVGVEIKNGKIDSLITTYTRAFKASITIHDGEAREDGPTPYMRDGTEQSASIYLPKGSTRETRHAAYDFNFKCFSSWIPCDTVGTLLPRWKWHGGVSY